MEKFIDRYSSNITGILKGFDRLVIRGSLRRIGYLTGMKDFLWHNNVLWKDFGSYALGVSDRIKEAARQTAETNKREYIYLGSSKTNKEAIATSLSEKQQINEGLIAILRSVELCNTYTVVRNKQEKKLELRIRQGKCLYLYFYIIDRQFGWVNARIQTWFPFNIQICLNGREWLSRKMDAAGIRYSREDNCFPQIQDLKKAQELMNSQLRVNWTTELKRFVKLLNPIHKQIFRKYPIDYYWTVFESEWATDVMFKDIQSLNRIYPGLVSHAIGHFSCSDVMKFLGRKLQSNFAGEIMTSFKNRPEGIRVKHWLDENSIKLYNKGSILRCETTINNPFRFRVFRATENSKNGECRWRRLRKSVADIHRLSQISEASNERYLNALVAADTSTTISQLVADVCKRTTWKGKPVRALRLWENDDLQLLTAITRGEFFINGFRNRDLQPLLYSSLPTNQKERKARSARISRLIRMLRAHHIVQKVSRTYRYVLSPRGSQIITAILCTQQLTIDQLARAIA
jgi:hypothetical protein